jgi:hypothetical protein
LKTLIAIVIALSIAVPGMACTLPTCTHNNTATATGIGVGVGIAKAEVGDITVMQSQERGSLAPEINPIVAPITPSDKFGTYSDLPLFASPVLIPLSKDDKVIRVIKNHSGGIFTSIRVEEVEQELLKLADEYKDYKGNLRYIVKYKMSVQSMGTGGGVAGSDIGASMAGTASMVPYAGSTTVNPKFFLIIYEVK